MTCEKRLLVQAYFDDELDAAAAIDIEAHLRTCADCSAWLRTLHELRTEIRAKARPMPAPARLVDAILAELDKADRSAPRGGAPLRAKLRPARGVGRPMLLGAAAGAALTALAATVTVMLWTPGANERFLDEVTTAHVRSLMADHLIDVASSDQHTVKPWFDGRVDVAPPVADFASEGFVLAGGRAEYIAGKRIPAVVYRGGGHVINLFGWPAGGPQTDGLKDHDGFHILTWHSGDLVFCAVSDIAPEQLEKLASLVRAEMAKAQRE